MNSVSVIIPTWNREKFLVPAVRSVLCQKGVDLEVLVCDDGSTDNSKNKIIALKDKRVIWLEGEHSGLPAVPRNRGIRATKGEWLAFLDSDDEWLENKLARQFEVMRRSAVLACCGNAYRITQTKNISGAVLGLNKENIGFFDLLKCNYIICSSVLVHRSIIEKAKGFPEDMNLKTIEDYALWLRMASLTKIKYVNELLLKYNDDVASGIRGQVFMTFSLQRKRALANYFKWKLGLTNENSSHG